MKIWTSTIVQTTDTQISLSTGNLRTRPRGNAMFRKTLKAFIGCAWLVVGAAANGDDETPIPLDDVPAAAINAAKNAVPGIVLTSAEIETERDQTVYELEGTVGEATWEVEVTPTGEVLEIEED
ncbi:MAG: hypothetical protein E2O48_02545 [Gemmatimonadetes bacterium]|nr:MAG: hypothetical protein E2O48_02545 [Gemmatimonadota bacterium]